MCDRKISPDDKVHCQNCPHGVLINLGVAADNNFIVGQDVPIKLIDSKWNTLLLLRNVLLSLKEGIQLK